MEGLAVLLLGLGAIASAQDAAYRDYHARYGVYPPSAYVAQAETGYYAYPPAYVYAPAPAPAIGAVTGGLIGAAAGGGAGAAIGMATGALIGHAATLPQPVPVAPAYAPTREHAAPARSAQFTDQYTQRWQSFMQPENKR